MSQSPKGPQLGDARDGTVGWSVDMWGGGGSGLKISLDAETNAYEFALLFTREEAENKEMLEHCQAAGPEDVVMMWGGVADKRRVVQFCRSVLALCEIGD